MKRFLPIVLCGLVLLLTGCAGSAVEEKVAQMNTYVQISQEEAKRMMDEQENGGPGVLVLDVREQDEYDAGHIPQAVLLPVGRIDAQRAAEVIAEKDDAVLVYCRSGNRSRQAAAALAALGYTQVYEFGGIMTWPYEIVKTQP